SSKGFVSAGVPSSALALLSPATCRHSRSSRVHTHRSWRICNCLSNRVMSKRDSLIVLGFSASLATAGVALVFRSAAIADGPAGQLNPKDPRTASFAIDCAVRAKAISPLIYGIGGSDNPWMTGTTAVRMGGNPTSRYNWQLDTWNAANDWYF